MMPYGRRSKPHQIASGASASGLIDVEKSFYGDVWADLRPLPVSGGPQPSTDIMNAGGGVLHDAKGAISGGVWQLNGEGFKKCRTSVTPFL